jgi:uncharacterized protein YndB with AHSA1/START domain
MMNETAAVSSKPVIHESFTIERRYESSAARVFAAFSDPAQKKRWFAEGPGSSLDEYSLDFRVGGREFSRFRVDSPEFSSEAITNDTYYFDIMDGQRIIFGYSMANMGTPFSASLTTITFEPAGDGTKLTHTEQVAFLDGSDGLMMREAGSRMLYERLAEFLGEQFTEIEWS